MSHESSESLLDNAKSYLEELYNAREAAIKRSRDVLVMCKRVITKCLRGDSDYLDALKNLAQLFNNFKNFVKSYPELYYSSFYVSIEMEYVEAVEFCTIIHSNTVKSCNELGVNIPSCILGLLDVIGELKRYSLELIRKERYEDSLRILEKAQQIFESIEDLAYYDPIVPGLRRKIDIYRKVIDDWRELLVDILSREELKKAIKSVKT